MKPHLVAGILAGLAVAVLGAGVWAFLALLLDYHVRLFAVVMACCVGFAVHVAGKGSTESLGVAGAVVSIFGCVLGNVLAVTMHFIDVNEGILWWLDWARWPTVWGDVLFWVLTAGFGYLVAIEPRVTRILS